MRAAEDFADALRRSIDGISDQLGIQPEDRSRRLALRSDIQHAITSMLAQERLSFFASASETNQIVTRGRRAIQGLRDFRSDPNFPFFALRHGPASQALDDFVENLSVALGEFEKAADSMADKGEIDKYFSESPVITFIYFGLRRIFYVYAIQKESDASAFLTVPRFQGQTSLNSNFTNFAINVLNELGIENRSGGVWSPEAVVQVIKRAARTKRR